MKKLVYIGSVGWANTASAIHVQNRARMIQELGIQVYAISDYPGEQNLISDIPELQYLYLTAYKGTRKIQGLKWHIDQFVCLFSYRQIIERLRRLQPDVVVLYEVNSMMLELLLRNYCKKHAVKFVIETTEWMEPEKYNDLYTKLIVKQKDLQKKYIDKKCKNIIAISGFLAEHYKQQGCNVVRIPPVFSGLERDFRVLHHKEERCDARINLVFAGTLSQKDFLEPILNTVVNLNKQNIQISFDVIGPTASEIQSVLQMTHLEKVGIFCHGKIEHEKVLRYVEKADFSILLRQNMRYARAGVSTKFVEAMSLGVPSICTKVGGTDVFVKNGENGFLVNSNTEQELIGVLENIMKMSDEEIVMMKRNAYNFARKHFAAEVYVDKIKKFLESCI